VRLLVCDDHAMFRDALCTALQSLGHDVVGTTGELHEVAELAADREPDACLLDLWFGDHDSLDVARAVRSEAPEVHVVLLSADVGAQAAAALDAGLVSAVAHKTWPLGVVAETLDRLADGRPARRLVPLPRQDRREPVPDLTDREQEVLRLVADGASTTEMRHRLGVSEHTVRSHVRHLMAKLGAHSRLEAVHRAHQHGLVSTGTTRS
jgi:two-component system nitrate/nitrite response regulator NarL